MATTTHSTRSVNDGPLFVSFELGKTTWTLGITRGVGVAPWVTAVPAGDLAAVTRTIATARRRLGVATGPVVSCYEAGRDGFWLHRALTAQGLTNRVVDSASIEVNRRARRQKTDRIDAIKLVMMLVRVWQGEPRVWREVHVPTEAAEAARHVSRERTALVKERTRLENQISSWLATWGCRVSRRQQRTADWWTQVRTWNAALLPAPVQARLARAVARRRVVTEHLAELDTVQTAAVTAAPAASALARLVQLKGVATTSASTLVAEGLVWRGFQNRRQVGGLLGFAPARYASGAIQRDPGISRAGNGRLQAVSIQLAWNWVRWQPTSAVTRWYRDRFGAGRRARRIGIVAVARKLVIALWRYATTGVVPAGAQLKPLA